MIRTEKLNYCVGQFALKGVSLHVRPGEYFVLLGPTGSGKTLLVESLCGLNRIDSGTIQIDGVEATRLEPRRRQIGYLPQDYALFSHQTVRRNIGFGLQIRRATRTALRETVDRLMDQLGVAHLAERLPERLSGGEKQRVALARALAIEPRVLILDEPVSAVDEATRDAVCRQLKQLQQTSGATMLHVCHNFAEMLAVADRVGIIHEGRLLQVGTPEEILQRPNSTVVARFVQAGNLFPAEARRDGSTVVLQCTNGLELRAGGRESGPDSGPVEAMIRPENVSLLPSPPSDVPPGTTILEGTIGQIVDFGPLVKVCVACGPKVEMLVFLAKKEYKEGRLASGQRVCLAIAAEDVHLMQV